MVCGLSQIPFRTEQVEEDSCPICYVSYKAYLAEEEVAQASEHSAAVATEELGVTSLKETCGHVFCRRE